MDPKYEYRYASNASAIARANSCDPLESLLIRGTKDHFTNLID